MWLFLNLIVKALGRIYNQLVLNGQKADATNEKLDEIIKLLTPPPGVTGFDLTVDSPTKQ